MIPPTPDGPVPTKEDHQGDTDRSKVYDTICFLFCGVLILFGSFWPYIWPSISSAIISPLSFPVVVGIMAWRRRKVLEVLTKYRGAFEISAGMLDAYVGKADFYGKRTLSLIATIVVTLLSGALYFFAVMGPILEQAKFLRTVTPYISVIVYLGGAICITFVYLTALAYIDMIIILACRIKSSRGQK